MDDDEKGVGTTDTPGGPQQQIIVLDRTQRRHLNAGQRAVLVALAYPEPTPGKRSVETTQVNSAVLSQARAIVKWCPEYVDDILAGIHAVRDGPTTLDEALKTWPNMPP